MKPIQYFVRENTWLKNTHHGWGNGYVAIPSGHPLFKKDYKEIEKKYNLNVHGGISFTGDAGLVPDCPNCLDGYWMIGFDTTHDGDNFDNWDMDAVITETMNLLEQCQKITK